MRISSPSDASPAPSDAPRYAVTIENVVRTFGSVRALDGVTAHIRQGSITGLVGADAAGKTTLMRLMAGLLLPDSGTVSIFGSTPDDIEQKQPGTIGYMPQRFGLYEDLTVSANMELHASIRGLRGEEKEDLFQRLLAFTDLGRFTRRLAGALSGGMKQKLGIACALLGSPRLLLLDEPGVGVDPLSRRELWDMVGELASNGMTVIWSTAYLDEAQRCPEIIMLDEGRVLWSGIPDDFRETVRGRVFLTSTGGIRPGAVLANWMTRDGVEDVRVQGSRLRVLTAADAPEQLTAELTQTGSLAEPTVEDAYMHAVGGVITGPSPYAADTAGPTETVTGNGSAAVIEARGLTKRFGSFTAADNITFSVQKGEIFGLLGPNGAGKSTTFRMLCGLSRPTSGDCRVAGIDMRSCASAARACIGYMAQKFSLYLDIAVKENIRIFAGLYGLSRAEQAERVPVLTQAFGIDRYMNSRTGDLSLGLKQRLALICATLHKPAVLFLDEPTSGVDARTRRDFWKHICAMTTTGTSILVTTHFMDEAEYCDRLALIYRGQTIRSGTPDDLRAVGHNGADGSLEEAFIAAVEEWNEAHKLETAGGKA